LPFNAEGPFTMACNLQEMKGLSAKGGL